MLSIRVEGAHQIVADFTNAPQQTQRATVRALNRAIGSARTVMVREIARDVGLKSNSVREALRLHEATFSRPEARVAASLKRIPLIDFGARGPEPSRGRGRGVSYRLSGSSGRLPHAFIATMSSGHRGVFTRTGRFGRRGHPRLEKIEEKFGPSLGHVFAKYRPLGIARALEVFEQRFAHELEQAGAGNAGAD